MPFMGGMEATELIRQFEMQEGLMPTPIIALTAHASMSLAVGYMGKRLQFFSDW